MALNGAYENKKVRRLARAMVREPWAALGLLEAVWAWVRRSARTGRIDPDQWDDLAEFLQWRESSTTLRQLLVDHGFIDPQEGWDWVHDWHHHADDSTRQYLKRNGTEFANGEAPRRWREANEKECRDTVATKPQNVATKEGNEEAPARARPAPAPVPAPVPVPAAATRAKRSTAGSPPPPLTDRAERIAEVLHQAMPNEQAPPDRAIVERVEAAMGEATVDELVAAVARVVRRRSSPPDSYGFWPIAIADELAPDRLAKLRQPKAPPAARRPIAKCDVCDGYAFVLREDGAGVSCPGCWASGGGVVSFLPGEQPELAAKLRPAPATVPAAEAVAV